MKRKGFRIQIGDRVFEAHQHEEMIAACLEMKRSWPLPAQVQPDDDGHVTIYCSPPSDAPIPYKPTEKAAAVYDPVPGVRW